MGQIPNLRSKYDTPFSRTTPFCSPVENRAAQKPKRRAIVRAVKPVRGIYEEWRSDEIPGPPYNGIANHAHHSLCPGLAVLPLLERGRRANARACGQGDAECKYWLHPDRLDIVEDFEYRCTPRLRREVRRIIFWHFDRIVAAWREHFGGDVAE